MPLAGNSHPIVTRGSRVSRAPPHPSRFSKSSWYLPNPQRELCILDVSLIFQHPLG